MDYYFIVVSTISGAIAGGFIGYFTYKSKQSPDNKVLKLGKVFGIITFATLSICFRLPEVKTPIMTLFDKNYAVKETIKVKMSSFLELPEVKARLSEFTDKEEANSFARNLVHNGLKRLSDDKLLSWNRIRLEMANKSAKMCAGFWTGKVSEDLLFDTFSVIDEKSVDEWINISITAAKLEAAQSEFFLPVEGAFKVGLSEIGKLHSSEEQLRMTNILAQGLNANDEDACWMMKTMMVGSEKIEREIGINFIRQLASF